jgi:hypothetical protein
MTYRAIEAMVCAAQWSDSWSDSSGTHATGHGGDQVAEAGALQWVSAEELENLPTTSLVEKALAALAAAD